MGEVPLWAYCTTAGSSGVVPMTTVRGGWNLGRFRFRAKREQLKTFEGLAPESQRQNLTLTLFYAPYLLDSGFKKTARIRFNTGCRGTSLTRKRPPLGPYHRPVPRVLRGS